MINTTNSIKKEIERVKCIIDNYDSNNKYLQAKSAYEGELVGLEIALNIVTKVKENNKMENKLQKLHEEFIKIGRQLVDEMYDKDVSSIENYPEYLPSFDEFIAEFSDVNYKEYDDCYKK